jgi:hypothetical protein
MQHVRHKDKQKEEVCPEKRRDQRQLLSVSQPPPWWKCLFPIFCMNFFLLSGENGTKKCYDPKLLPFVKMIESGSLLVIQAHQQIILKLFIRFRSDFLKPLRHSAVSESPKVSQIPRDAQRAGAPHQRQKVSVPEDIRGVGSPCAHPADPCHLA